MEYKFKAYNSNGNLIKGKVNVSKESEVYSSIRDEYIVDTIIDVQKNFKISDFILNFKENFYETMEILKEKFNVSNQNQILKENSKSVVRKDYNDKTLLQFSKKMTHFLKSGVSVLRAFEIIIERTEDVRFKQVLLKTQSMLKKGIPLHECLKKSENFFGDLFVSIIEVGEESGDLEGSFKELEETYKYNMTVKKEINKAMAYPYFIFGITSILLLVISFIAVPRYQRMFKRARIELSPFTKTIFSITSNFHWVLLGILSFIVFLQIIKHTQPKIMFYYKKILDNFKMKIPFVKDFIRLKEMYYFNNVLYILLKNGIDVMLSLEHAKNSINNIHIKKQFENISSHIKNGKNLSQTLRMVPIIDEETISLIEVGEETGNISTSLESISDMKKEELLYKTEIFLKILEPVSFLFMAFLISPILFALMQPMLNLINGI